MRSKTRRARRDLQVRGLSSSRPASKGSVSSGPFGVLLAEHADLARRLEQVRRLVAADDAAFARSVRALHACLVAHHRREDRVLVPLCERLYGGPDGPSSVLRREHAIIQRDSAVLANGQALRSRPAAVERLSRGLQAHISREERVLFPLTAALLSETETSAVARRLGEPCP